MVQSPEGNEEEETHVECRCCSQRAVIATQIDEAFLRARFPSTNEAHSEEAESVRTGVPTGPARCERFACTVCRYEWVEATRILDGGHERIESLSFPGRSDAPHTMHVRVRADPDTGEENVVDAVYQIGSRAVGYRTWHAALVRQRINHAETVAGSDPSRRVGTGRTALLQQGHHSALVPAPPFVESERHRI